MPGMDGLEASKLIRSSEHISPKPKIILATAYGGEALAQQADGTFVFPQQVSDNGQFSVTVKTQPSHPAQTCSPANSSGIWASACR